MTRFTSPLAHVKVAAPCPADWSKMIGNDQVRFCGQCSLNVYNLSGMSKKEAESLIARTEGRLCIRYYQRADGSILTTNCPVGLRALKRRMSRIANATLSAVLSFLAGVGIYAGLPEAGESERHSVTTGVMVYDEPNAIPTATPEQEKLGEVMGEVAVMGTYVSPSYTPAESHQSLSRPRKRAARR